MYRSTVPIERAALSQRAAQHHEADRRDDQREDRPAGAEAREDREQDARDADQAERPGGEHEAVGALLALLAGHPGALAAFDVTHRLKGCHAAARVSVISCPSSIPSAVR